MEIQDLYKIYLSKPRVTTDTRKEVKNTIFFCLKGPNFDANTFALTALERGAAHVVADDPQLKDNPNITLVYDVLTTLQKLARHHRDQFKFPVIGLTGSNGKTTNKELIAAVLSRKYRTYFTQGNLNNHIGVPLTLLSIPLDAEMAVIEMGANAQGEIRDLSNISDPDYGMITNIGKAHLEGFGGIEGVKKGKSELYKHIKAKSAKLFVNGDDEVLMELSEGIEKTLFGSSQKFSCNGSIQKRKPFISFDFEHQGEASGEIQTQLVGTYNFSNLMAAACIGCYFDVSVNEIAAALKAYRPNNNRSEMVDTGKNKLILDAYNANPSSMELAMSNFAEMDHEPKLALIGHMLELGEESKVEHQKLVDHLSNLKLRAVLVGSNFNEVNKKGFHYCETPKELKKWLQAHSIENHLIIVKGSRMVAMENAKEFL
ncbi:UDP-N-acetylmuramoyl-tripeptide--D-alanyl-D-alanine ligase [Cryomorphaceae bacterium 1068]|nr:UDP-N-acetylmuramoyl-tripeptide--D-alanyl-D-alanine ligase [Cryomorphaceae bacterium 1068]